MRYAYPRSIARDSAMREQGLTHIALANRLGLQEKSVRRLLNPTLQIKTTCPFVGIGNPGCAL